MVCQNDRDKLCKVKMAHEFCPKYKLTNTLTGK